MQKLHAPLASQVTKSLTKVFPPMPIVGLSRGVVGLSFQRFPSELNIEAGYSQKFHNSS